MGNKRMQALQMIDLQSWRELTKGFYRFVFSPGACYEIVVLYARGTDIESSEYSKATLYCTGTWTGVDGTCFDRVRIFDGSLEQCMYAAKKDYEENVTEE